MSIVGPRLNRLQGGVVTALVIASVAACQAAPASPPGSIGAASPTTSLASPSQGAVGPSPSVDACHVAGVLSSDPACVAALGPVTLKVVDVEGEGGYQDLVNEAFKAKYPNVTIERTPTSYGAWVSEGQLKFNLLSDNPADIVTGDSADASFADLVKAGLILPLQKYADAWDWDGRLADGATFPQTIQADGKHPGSGELFGLSPTLSMVGWYYNKALLDQIGGTVPETTDELKALLEKAKAAGIVPIQGGDGNGAASNSLWISAFSSALPAETWKAMSVASLSDVSALDQGGLVAGQLAQDWASYLPEGFEGVAGNDARDKFGQGEGLFFQGGSWNASKLGSALADKVGFFLPPRATPGPKSTLFGQNTTWMVSSKTANPDLAAIYLDFLASPDTVDTYLSQDTLPAAVVDPANATGTSPVFKDILTAAKYMDENGSAAPWPIVRAAEAAGYNMDSEGQKLIRGETTPQEWLDYWKEATAVNIESVQ